MPASAPNRSPIVGGNWKMNTLHETATALAEAVGRGAEETIDRCDVVVYPPYPYLGAAAGALDGTHTRLGAQDVSPEPSGAFTGEVSATMLLDVGVGVVLAGHSERRHVIGEDDALVNAKVQAALAAGLDVTLCVGETQDERAAERTSEVVLGQLDRGLEGVDASAMDRVVIAYEPVWAIGTGLAATPDDAETVHALVRGRLATRYDDGVAGRTRIQYGGSVKPANAAELIAQPNVDGFLVGGASLDADAFLAIVHAAAGVVPASPSSPAQRTS